MTVTLSSEDAELIIEALDSLQGSSFLNSVTKSQKLAISQRVQQIKDKLVEYDEC